MIAVFLAISAALLFTFLLVAAPGDWWVPVVCVALVVLLGLLGSDPPTYIHIVR